MNLKLNLEGPPPARRRPGEAGLRLSRLSACLLAVTLGACAVTPAYQSPAVPKAEAGADYTETPMPPKTVATAGRDGVAQAFVPGKDIPGEWWTLFRSEALDQLIRQALAHNPSLGSAQASLRQAEETYRSTYGSLALPSVTGNLQAGRERVSAVSSGVPGGSVFNLYNASVNVSYTIDVFGANQKTLEGQQAAIDYQRYQLQAAYLTLTSNVVTTAVREASLRAQLQATQELLAAQEAQLEALQRQYAVGGIALAPVLAQRSLVAGTRASLPALDKSLAQTRHQLAVLAGRLPGEQGLAQFDLDSLQLPAELPVSLGSELVHQRPDILASEAQLHQAAAQVGVATANLYPQFNLTAGLGSTATKSGQLFEPGWGFWSLLGGLTQPLYNGGSLEAKRRAALAGLDAAAGQYRSTVLQAFQNVADSLRALDADALALKQQVEAESVARESLQLSQRQYQLGAVSYLSLLDAERSYQQARINLVSARAARYADTAALFQSLGGGWWNHPDLPQVPVALQANDR
ncbi:MAG: efflux transporter outer membrane subunit [Curvibacter sp.]|nr:efflux transporter outer membrane subunit [Curvibacter sp.]